MLCYVAGLTMEVSQYLTLQGRRRRGGRGGSSRPTFYALYPTFDPLNLT